MKLDKLTHIQHVWTEKVKTGISKNTIFKQEIMLVQCFKELGMPTYYIAYVWLLYIKFVDMHTHFIIFCRKLKTQLIDSTANELAFYKVTSFLDNREAETKQATKVLKGIHLS